MRQAPPPRAPATPDEADRDWEDRVAQAWATLDEAEPRGFVERIDALAAERPEGDPVALFERGCAQDSTGHPELAVPLYRAALEARLSGLRRRRATIQLASSLRVMGRVDDSIALLEPELDAPVDTLTDAVRGFLALSLAERGREREALSMTLVALSRHLPRYDRSLARYAQALVTAGEGGGTR
jgi:tetratricopeptide (TPR) repeat protein